MKEGEEVGGSFWKTAKQSPICRSIMELLRRPSKHEPGTDAGRDITEDIWNRVKPTDKETEFLQRLGRSDRE